MADSDLILEIDGDSKEFEKALKDLNKSSEKVADKMTADFKKSAKEQSAAFEKSFDEVAKSGSESAEKIKSKFESIKKVGSVISFGLKSALAGIGAGFTGSVFIGAGFEQQMKNVQAIAGTTGEELDILTKKAREMGEKTAFSAKEAGEAFQYMAMAGWDTSKMVDGIEGLMNLAAASGENLGRVSDIVTDALTAFRLEAKDAGHFADVLAMTASKANTNIDMLGYTFQYVAPVAGALKFSVEDVAVAVGLMANAGIKAEKSGTALRAIINRLVNPTKQSQEAIDKLGLVVTNADGTMRSLNDIIVDMRRSFATLSDAEKASTAGALAGTEAMSGLLAVVNASDEEFNTLAESINNANGKAKEMAETMLDTLSGRWQIFKSTLQETGLIIYDSLEAPMKRGVEEAQKGFKTLNDNLKEDLQPQLQTISKSFGGLFDKVSNFLAEAVPVLVRALSVVLDNLENIYAVFMTIVGAFAGFKGAMVMLTFAEALAKVRTALNLAKSATIAFNLALLANPATAIVTAISTIIGALTALAFASDEVRYKLKTSFYEIEYGLSNLLKGSSKMADKYVSGIVGVDLEELGYAGKQEQKSMETPEEYAARLKKEMGLADKEVNKLKESLGGVTDEIKKAYEAQQTLLNGFDETDEKPFNLPNFPNNEAIGTESTSAATSKEIAQSQKEELKKINEISNFITKQADSMLAGHKKRQDELQAENERFADNITRGLANSLRSAMQGEYSSTQEAMRGIGYNLVTTLADSMLEQSMGYLKDALSTIGSLVISSMKGFFGIASPSKVFKKIGYENMRGLALGFTENQNLIDNATNTVGNNLLNDFNNFNPTVTPSFNLQNLKDMFNINAVAQPHLAGAAAGASNIINIDLDFALQGSGAGGNGQSVTSEDLNSFAKEIKKTVKSIVIETFHENMRSGGMLAK